MTAGTFRLPNGFAGRSVGVAMYDDDALRPSRGLMHGVAISAILYVLLAGIVWLAL